MDFLSKSPQGACALCSCHCLGEPCPEIGCGGGEGCLQTHTSLPSLKALLQSASSPDGPAWTTSVTASQLCAGHLSLGPAWGSLLHQGGLGRPPGGALELGRRVSTLVIH